MKLGWSVEGPEILGTGGALRKLEDSLTDTGGPFLLLNGDSILGLDLPALIGVHRSHREDSGTIATLLCRRHPRAESYGAVRVAADGRVLDMAGLGRLPGVTDEELAAATPTVFCGVHVIEPEVVASLPPDGTESCIVRQGYAPLIAAGRDVRAFLAPNDMFFHDVGTPARYLDAQAALLRGELSLPVGEGVEPLEALFQEGSYAGDAEGREYGNPDAVQGLAKAKLEPPFFFGPMNELEAGASVGPNASLGLGCTVASGGRVEDSALWSFVNVGRGEALRGQLAAKLGEGIIRLDGRES
jgi:mannose-1-phosphate guanylyltransferase